MIVNMFYLFDVPLQNYDTLNVKIYGPETENHVHLNRVPLVNRPVLKHMSNSSDKNYIILS